MHEDQKLNSLQHEDQDFISRLTCYLVLEKLAFGKEFLNLATPPTQKTYFSSPSKKTSFKIKVKSYLR